MATVRRLYAACCLWLCLASASTAPNLWPANKLREAEQQALQMGRAAATGTAEERGLLAAVLMGQFDAAPLGELLESIEEQYKNAAAAAEADAVNMIKSSPEVVGDVEPMLRSAAELRLRGSLCGIQQPLLEALGFDAASRSYVYAWQLLEHHCFGRGHRALAMAARRFPAQPRLAEERAKQDAFNPACCDPSDASAVDASVATLESFAVPLHANEAAAAAAMFRGSTELITQSVGESPVLSVDECAEAIALAEAYAASSGGWTSTRHTAYATVDLPVHVVGGRLLEWFNGAMRE